MNYFSAMEPDRGYVDYVIAFSLTMFAGSAAYFFDPSNPFTYVTLLTIPLIFGYTAYRSRKGFQKSSLLSLTALVFAIINPLTAVLVLIIGFGTPLVSVFAGGQHFHDYFHAISVPLIILGLIIGGIGYSAISTQPQMKQNIVNNTANFVGHGTESFVKQSNIIENVEDTQVELIRGTSRASIGLTAQIVRNESFDSLDSSEKVEVSNAFEQASNEVPDRLAEQAVEGANEREVDISDQISGTVKTTLGQTNMIFVIPLAAFVLYSLNPLIGLLTAIFATLFGALDREFDVFAAY
jgi:hypothetical protein